MSSDGPPLCPGAVPRCPLSLPSLNLAITRKVVVQYRKADFLVKDMTPHEPPRLISDHFVNIVVEENRLFDKGFDTPGSDLTSQGEKCKDLALMNPPG